MQFVVLFTYGKNLSHLSRCVFNFFVLLLCLLIILLISFVLCPLCCKINDNNHNYLSSVEFIKLSSACKCSLSDSECSLHK